MSDNTSHEESSHPMITRLKSGATDKKSYTKFIAYFPELNSLLLDDEFKLSRGFSFLAAISDSDEPSSFRKACTIPQWQVAIQDEYNSLKT